MKIFAVSDLHLSLGGSKPMDIFGAGWENHWQKIAADWQARVRDEDVVLVAGDISWGMKYEESLADMAAVCAMPGHKVLIKGNHDFWHSSLQKTRALLTNSTYFLQNDSVSIGGVCFAGTRGWPHPGEEEYSARDAKVYAREIERLRLSLRHAAGSGLPIVGMMHYPPFSAGRKPTPFTQLFEEYGVRTAIFGHIHGEYTRGYEQGPMRVGGVDYILTSCDHLGFKLTEIS